MLIQEKVTKFLQLSEQWQSIKVHISETVLILAEMSVLSYPNRTVTTLIEQSFPEFG